MTSTLLARSRSSLATSSFSLLVGKVVQMCTGMAFWFLAARSTTVDQLGLATATVAAVMLCTQIALLGAGSAVITELPRERVNWAVLLHTAFTVVVVGAAILSLGYLLIAGQLSRELHTVLAEPGYAGLFVMAAIFGTLIICFDQVSIATGRPNQTAVRYTVGGTVTIGVLVTVSLASPHMSASGLFAVWALGALAACAIGWIQLRRSIGYRYRPSLDLRRTRRLLRIGVPNQVLTLTERLPALIVPVLVVDLASPAMAAYWYPAWMMAWSVYSAPVMVGLVQFADTVRHPDQIRAMAVSAIRWSLLLGGPLALVVAVLAGPLLSLFGDSYANAAANGLRILVVGLLPYTLIQVYNAACRATGHLREAVVAGLCIGVVLVGSTTAAATSGSVTLMAAAWVLTLTVAAGWAIIRLLGIAAATQPRSVNAEAMATEGTLP